VTGRRVLVTGASSGIGAAVVRALAGHGWQVLATGRDEARLAAVAGPHGDRVAGVTADLTDAAETEALVRAACATPLHGVVHAAGVIALGTVAGARIEDLELQWRVNLEAPYRLTQLLLPALRSGGGHVVFINSGSGRRANAGWAAYAATKFALRALADALRAEEAAHGVRVTSIYPGRTDTPMQRAVYEAEGRGYDPAGLVPAHVVAEVVRQALETSPPALLSDVDVRPG
jgi:NAD(P)-dependent dehydrogenase (short-subunit alcohol dehydrogenase family)